MSSQDATQQAFRCPECRTAIPLTEALTASLRDQLLEDTRAEIRQRLQAQRDEYELRIAAERDKARAEALEQDALARKAQDEELAAQREELSRLRHNELALLRQKRDLERSRETIALDVERRLNGARQEIEAEIRGCVAEQHRLKDLEKDRQLQQLRDQVDVLSRQAHQGSHQIQGEVLELDLESQLRAAFPSDRVESVSPGVRGADVLQTVVDARGHVAGTILWEAKNTKTFSETWLPKLRRDQRAQNADLGVLVTAALPRDVEHCAERGKVWVTGLFTAMPLAAALRGGLIEAARARASVEGQAEKQTAIYEYISGKGFKQHIEAIVEEAALLLQDLQKERASIERQWASREQHVHGLIRAVAGLYGDVDGIVGGSLPRIPRLELSPPKAA